MPRYTSGPRRADETPATPEAPRRKGFFALLFGNFGVFVKLNAILLLFVAPPAVCLTAGLLLRQGGAEGLYWLLLLAALLLCAPLGGGLAAAARVLVEVLRQKPVYVWHRFKRAFQEDVRPALPAGLLCGAVVAAQVVLYFEAAALPGAFVRSMLLGSVLLLGMFAPYWFLQAALVELPAFTLLRNGMVLALGRAPRSLAGALLGGGLLVAQFLLLPLSLPVLALCGLSVPVYVGFWWAWPVVDDAFGIGKTLRAREEQ